MALNALRQPAIALVDDDFHSARLMMRMLAAHGGPDVERMADPDSALETLACYATMPSAPITETSAPGQATKRSGSYARPFMT